MSQPKPPPLIRKTAAGLTWIDTAALALLCLNSPIPSASTRNFMDTWVRLDAHEKDIEARRLLTPHFTLDELITKSRIVSKARAAQLLKEHVSELAGAVVPMNVRTEERPKVIAVARGWLGAHRFLDLLNEHRDDTRRKDQSGRIKELVDEMFSLCQERTTPERASALVERFDYLTELHGFVRHLTTSIALRQLAVAPKETI
jgi:hypothetical protein